MAPPNPIDPAAPTILGAAPPSHAGPLHPGSTLANRYRIVTLLGRGGMGEVYRADDLELGTPVALKVLPAELAADPIRLDRFRAEVRLARNISHPNIVRVYDIVTTPSRREGAGGGPSLSPSRREGPSVGPSASDAPSTLSSPPLTFLTMEFVDGEDLASLLRRIGRLPQDKAVQIARQLCFGLAAAHEQGVIHRDLKPANIMIDGRGNARIMDFGVAGLAADLIAAGDITSGTPAYMAPEQLAGREVSKKSDLYSLGLVLYELFTGKPAIAPQSIPDLRKFHDASTRPESLSRHVADLDPAIERIVLRCLEPEPADRPASAIAIAAALPGGDPLAAALAAGETPSPELIASSGASQTISPIRAWARAAAVAAMLLAIVLITVPWTMVSQVKPAKSPEVLQDRALEVINALGYTNPPADTARGFNSRDLFIQRINLDPTITDKPARLRARPGPYEFWYRQSPYAIESALRNGTVGLLSPTPDGPGEIAVRTDSSGRLEFFSAIPPRRRAETPSPEIPDATVKRLFGLADLDPSRFTPADPIFRPFAPIDSVRSWTGSLAEQPDMPLRVHLGSAEGRVAYFSVAYPWSVAAISAAPSAPEPRSALDYASNIVLAVVMLATCRLVSKNIRSGRGDRAGALRLAIAVFFFAFLNLLFVQHRLPNFRSIFSEGGGFAPAAFAAVEFWFFYIALEPYARRVYPQSLISWTRILRGQFGDPLVGRHVLVGLLVGSVGILCTAVFVSILHTAFKHNHPVAFYGRTNGYLGGLPVIAALTADTFTTALMLGAGTMLPVVMGQLAFKRRWAGYLLLVIALVALDSANLRTNPIDSSIDIILSLIPILAIPSGGLLALVVAHATMFMGQMLPIGLDWSHWFAVPVLLPAGILAALTIHAARSASAGRSASL